MYIRQDRGYLHELEKKHVYTFFSFFLSWMSLGISEMKKPINTVLRYWGSKYPTISYNSIV